MNEKIKKILAMILIIFITLEAVSVYKEPIIANAMTKNEYDQKINAFINDYRWRNGVEWGYYKEPLIAYNGIGCCAYVNDFVRYVYGADNQNVGAEYTGVSNIQTGDVLYIYNSSWKGHWIVVLGRNGNTLYTAEGNVYDYKSGAYKVRISNNQYQISGDALNSNYVGTYTLTKGYHYDTIVSNPQVDYMQLYVDAPMDGDVVKGKQLEVWGWSQYKKYENDPLIGANITASINGKTYNLPPVEHLLEDKLPRFWTFLPETAIKGGKNTITVTASYNGITQSQTKTFTVTTPSISNVKCSEQDTSSNPYYTVTCNVSDDTEVAYVDFKIWTEANGEDDVEWQKAAVNKKTGTATCKIYKHKNEKGKYKVTIYAHRTETIYSESTYSFESLFVYPLKNISLNKTAMSINTGETENLSVNYNPSYTTDNKAITWSSNNPQIVTVSNTGQVMAKTKGTAIITAKVGNYSAYCTVTVNDIIPTGISLDKTNITLTSKNETATLKATVKPDDAKDKSIKWSTDNSAVAIVDGNGKVTAVGNGIATITAMTNSGAKSATCVVIVNIQNKIILGDVNNDGFINIQDAVILKKHLAGVLILNINKTASDINNDGKIDISDAVVLLKHLAGIIV